MANELDSKRKFELITSAISWLNDTFTKLGMKPIEDLPKAWVCNSSQCVLARALIAGLEDKYDNISVDYGSINMNKIYIDTNEDPLYSFNVPEDVRLFIQGFDAGQFPEFIAEDNTKDSEGEGVI